MRKYRILIEEREDGHKYYMPQTKVLFFWKSLRRDYVTSKSSAEGIIASHKAYLQHSKVKSIKAGEV
ncbi:hypothetical protein ZK1_47 [Klebsiella phage vB_KpnP_ZK1]|nr:hypothetical protein ZK1_47 [Klebsiella phage vB_KpnP_ZK1]